MKQESVMILGASALQIPAIQYAKKLGLQVILVDYDPNAVGFQFGDKNLLISTLDQEKVLEAARKYQPDYIMTSTSDGPVRTAAYVNEQMGKKPDLSYENARRATIKSEMRECLKKHGVAIPKYYVVNSKEEYWNAVQKLTQEKWEAGEELCKIVVKPSDNAGSRGVVLLEVSQNDDKEKWTDQYEFAKENSRNGVVLVEEYMEGEEVSVESLTVDGKTTVITITDKLTTAPPYFVELGHVEPSGHSKELQKKIEELTLQAVKAIGLCNGPSHTEIKLTKEGPKIVELAARLGGDFITSKLVPLSTGVNMVENSVNLVVGRPVCLKKTREEGAAICFIPSKKGVIQEINIPEQLKEQAGIEEIVLNQKVADVVGDTKSSNQRLGYVIATGKNGEEALQRAKEAVASIQIEIH